MHFSRFLRKNLESLSMIFIGSVNELQIVNFLGGLRSLVGARSSCGAVSVPSPKSLVSSDDFDDYLNFVRFGIFNLNCGPLSTIFRVLLTNSKSLVSWGG